MHLLTLLLSVALIVPTAYAGTNVIYVDDDAPLGGDGQSWKTAFRYMQDAVQLSIDALPIPSEIRIAQGTYTPDHGGFATPGDRKATFEFWAGVNWKGGYRGAFDGTAGNPNDRDVATFLSILSGDLFGDDNSGGSNAENTDILIKNVGSGPPLTMNGVVIASADDGLLLTDSDASFVQCTLQLNQYGMHIMGGSPSFEQCKFYFNWLGAATIRGTAAPRFEDCSFERNIHQALLHESTEHVSFNRCTFDDNAAFFASEQGTIVIKGDATFLHCRVSGNVGSYGAAFDVQSMGDWTTLQLLNCLLHDNIATVAGAGVHVRSATGPIEVQISNCTIVDNWAMIGGAVFLQSVQGDVNVAIENSILWENGSQQIYDPFLLSQVTNCIIEGGLPWAVNSLADDPLLDSGINSHYQLTADSPAIDRGHNWLVPLDTADSDHDGNSNELLPVDLLGVPRFADGGNSTSCNAPASVDIGAFEYQSIPLGNDLCLGDTNGDEVIDVTDLFQLLSQWGNCTTGCCLGDLNVNDVIDVSDLFELLAAWGPCE